jgi:ABC-type branched-subunit amino acid transport system ATPase component
MAAASAFQDIQAEDAQISPTGKSTIIKLLTRLYDVTSGEILIDGTNIKEYNLEDLKRATASLAQDHTVFPLSVAENVGLGDPSCVSDMDAITESTRKGGADHFIQKFSDGSQTVLDVETYGYCTAVADHPLQGEWRKLPKKVDVSGIFLSSLCKT